MSLYHIARPDGTRMGPYDAVLVKAMLNSGQLSPNCLVWTEGWADWKPISFVFPVVHSTSDATAWGPIVAFKSVVFGRYATFTGRASRSEYWWYTLSSFALFSFIFILLTFVGGFFVGLTDCASDDTEAAVNVVVLFAMLITMLLGLGLTIPSIAVTVRRLHDAGFSGWFYLINFVPYVGGLILFVFTVLPSAAPNQWGSGPDKPAV